MQNPEPAMRSDLPDLNGTSLEELRTRGDLDRERAKERLLKAIGRPARSASPGTGDSWAA
jgi:hypothetical protein